MLAAQRSKGAGQQAHAQILRRDLQAHGEIGLADDGPEEPHGVALVRRTHEPDLSRHARHGDSDAKR